MTTASDAFNRANETPLATPWANCYGSGANLSSNAVTSTGGTDKGSFYNSGSWGNNQQIDATISGLGISTNYAALLARADSSGNAIQVYTDGVTGAGHTGIAIWSGGTPGSEVANWATTFADGDKMRITVTGASPNIVVELFKDTGGGWVSQGQKTGITGPDSGNPGIAAFGVATVDDWNATDAFGSITINIERGGLSFVGRSVAISAPVQTIRPDADVIVGNWLPSGGSPAALWAMLDETDADDADYIYAESNSECEVSLSNAVDPGTNESHVLRVRLAGDDESTITLTLKQGGSGGTVIATRTISPAPTRPTTFQWTLTTGEASAIVDYSNLVLNIQAAR